MDWYALQALAVLKSVRKPKLADSNLTEAIEFLNGPNFLPAESKPAELEFTSKIHFAFQSPRPCDFAENNVVHGRSYRREKDWQKFPTVILLHGDGDFLNHRYRFPWIIPAVHRAGFNAATLVLPTFFNAAPGVFSGTICGRPKPLRKELQKLAL